MATGTLRMIREETTPIEDGNAYAYEWEIERDGRTRHFTIAHRRTDTETTYALHTRVEIRTVGGPVAQEPPNLQEITVDAIKGEIHVEQDRGKVRRDFMTTTIVSNGGFTTRDSREVDVRLDLEAYKALDMATMLRRQFLGEA